ncbi:LacI family DNA-binding transcriptional regulator [uncultured Amaricoccus sp.]|uniref:LacI family DNA-binding transcriptional regulator n=1 Tax=uncultured Amaricoccus sp. TaxID=339341 RepID=UPI00260601B1|nr:LacI family DNA-binding transcriptional regulator [uncultured Amaricoccus sp.]
MRPTTKDLARAAGVSLATIDRVLNGRPGVREETAQAVGRAIDELGFVRNLSAANLARGRSYRFVFLLPRHGDQFLEALVERIEEAREGVAGDAILVRHLRVLDEDPHQTARIIAEQSPDMIDGLAIMAPESPQVRDAINRLIERGVEVVQFVSAQSLERRIDFVGIDNHAAGATAARLLGRFAGAARGKVLVVAETMNARDSLERRRGFDGVLTAGYPDLVALPSLETHGDAERARRVVRNVVTSHPEIVAAYILSSEARAPLEALRELCDLSRIVVVTHERTRYTEAGLASGDIDVVIAQDPGHLVRSAIRLLRARSDDREPIASQERVRIDILIKENLGASDASAVRADSDPATPARPP